MSFTVVSDAIIFCVTCFICLGVCAWRGANQIRHRRKNNNAWQSLVWECEAIGMKQELKKKVLVF
jgi:hypothetical protein